MMIRSSTLRRPQDHGVPTDHGRLTQGILYSATGGQRAGTYDRELTGGPPATHHWGVV